MAQAVTREEDRPPLLFSVDFRKKTRLIHSTAINSQNHRNRLSPCLSGYRHSYWISNCSGLVNGAGLSSTLTEVTLMADMVRGSAGRAQSKKGVKPKKKKLFPSPSTSTSRCSLPFFVVVRRRSNGKRRRNPFGPRCARRSLVLRGRFLLRRRDRAAARPVVAGGRRSEGRKRRAGGRGGAPSRW